MILSPKLLFSSVLAVGLASASLADGSGPTEAEDLAKQLSNPVADLVSVPLQWNWEQGVGPNDDLRFVVNFQPVVPFSLSEKWNLIGRFILPYLSQPALLPDGESTAGTSDIILSAFFSPAKPGRAVWGVGPVFGLPTTTDPLLGSGKWSIGPTAVVLKQSGPWTYGALVNHLVSFADTGDVERADVNQTFLQPFLTYTTPSAVTVALNTESIANWEAPDGEEWTVPVNLQVSKVTKLGPFPFSVGGALGYYAASPEGGPDWKLRLITTLILPRKK